MSPRRPVSATSALAGRHGRLPGVCPPGSVWLARARPRCRAARVCLKCACAGPRRETILESDDTTHSFLRTLPSSSHLRTCTHAQTHCFGRLAPPSCALPPAFSNSSPPSRSPSALPLRALVLSCSIPPHHPNPEGCFHLRHRRRASLVPFPPSLSSLAHLSSPSFVFSPSLFSFLPIVFSASSPSLLLLFSSSPATEARLRTARGGWRGCSQCAPGSRPRGRG